MVSENSRDGRRPPREGSLRVKADALYIDVGCGDCNHAFSLAIGSARNAPDIGCPHCRSSVNLGTDAVRDRIASAEQTLWHSHHALANQKRREQRELAKVPPL